MAFSISCLKLSSVETGLSERQNAHKIQNLSKQAFWKTISIVHNPKVSIIRLESTSVSPGLRLGLPWLEITDSLIVSDAKMKNLPDYANHLSPGCRCWHVVSMLLLHSCGTPAEDRKLNVPGYSKDHTLVGRLLGLGRRRGDMMVKRQMLLQYRTSFRLLSGRLRKTSLGLG